MVAQNINRFIGRAIFPSSEEVSLLTGFFEDLNHGTFIDIGANEPQSAVSFDLMKRGWSGLAIDPLPENAEKLAGAGFAVWCGAVASETQAAHKEARFHIAGGASGRKSSLDADLIDPALETREIVVPLKTLAEIITEFGATKLNLLSLDVEGCEMDVLSTLPDRFPIDLILVEDWARDTSLHELITSKGYKRVRRTGYNSWYVPQASDLIVSWAGQLHLLAKLNWFAPIRKWRFEKKKRRFQDGSGQT